MKNFSSVFKVSMLVMIMVFSFACAREEPSQKERERIMNIESQLRRAPAGSFFEMSNGTIYVIRANFDKGASIYFLQWHGEEIRLNASILAKSWKVQSVVVPGTPIWSRVAEKYLPHELQDKN